MSHCGNCAGHGSCRCGETRKPERKIEIGGGFIQLVDVMGSDHDIAEAARTSYGTSVNDPQKDARLINYLMRHGHTSPFEMAELKFLVEVPMDVWRQWIRHRTASVNEYSTRYSVAIDRMTETGPAEWRRQDWKNRQGSNGFLPEDLGRELSREEKELQEHARKVYSRRLELGVAREQARKDLPLCTYTRAYWKIDLHNLFHFLQLRLDSHAQQEIRNFACAILKLITPVFPMSVSSFSRYVTGAVTFSTEEQVVLSSMLLSAGGVPKGAELTESESEDFMQKIYSMKAAAQPAELQKNHPDEEADDAGEES